MALKTVMALLMKGPQNVVAAQMISLLVLMIQYVFLSLIDAMEIMIVKMHRMNLILFAHHLVRLICLLVLMIQNVFRSHIFAMDIMIVRILPTNLPQSAPLHAQLTCLPVLTSLNAFKSQHFATGTPLVRTFHTALPHGVTTALLTICSNVKIMVLKFV